MSRHILVQDGTPSRASRSAVMVVANQAFGRISFETLQKCPEADRVAAGIFLNCQTINPPLLEYQTRSAETAQTDGFTAWFATTVSDIPLDDAKAKAIKAASDKRYAVENGGTYMGSVFLNTERPNRGNYSYARARAVADNNFAIPNWKVGDGIFTALNAQQIIDASDTVHEHVQAAYDHEASLVASIVAAADLTALRAINIDAGWPSNEAP